ncbi:MAG: SurA N-terminal domain-containing protein [Pseudomonadota bacterium]
MMLKGILWLVTAALPATAESGDTVLPLLPEVVARVNDVTITRLQFEARIAQSRSMNPELFDAMAPEQKTRAVVRVLNAMVLRELEVQEARRKGIAVPEKEVEQHLSELELTYANKGGLKQALADFRITLEQWKEETRRNLLLHKLEESMYRQIAVSEEDIREEFTRNFWREKTPPTPKDLDEHREHMRMVIQERRWAERRKPWLESLVNAAEIWRWTPPESRKDPQQESRK